MLHKNRAYTIKEYDLLDEMATALTEMTWCGCNGFRWQRVTLLNDATSGDGAQEYGVFITEAVSGLPVQVESITVSWMDKERLMDLLTAYNRMGVLDFNPDFAGTPKPIPEHGLGPCWLCA